MHWQTDSHKHAPPCSGWAGGHSDGVVLHLENKDHVQSLLACHIMSDSAQVSTAMESYMTGMSAVMAARERLKSGMVIYHVVA